MNWLHNLIQKPKHLLSETIVIEPGMSADFDTLTNTPGNYSVSIDLSSMTNIDSLSIQIYLTPAPDQPELLYIQSQPNHTQEPLWNIDIPPSSGFRIRYTMGTGKNMKIKTHIWENG